MREDWFDVVDDGQLQPRKESRRESKQQICNLAHIAFHYIYIVYIGFFLVKEHFKFCSIPASSF